jgi:hypothetical protein
MESDESPRSGIIFDLDAAGGTFSCRDSAETLPCLPAI